MCVSLAEAKRYLQVIHDEDDETLALLLDGAIDEALQITDRAAFTAEELAPPSFKLGVLILLQAAYQASPDEQSQLRAVAEIKLFPHRKKLGV